MTDEQIRDAIAEFDHDKDGQVRMLNCLKILTKLLEKIPFLPLDC
jgi:Ca2+-binding EF-hand superfamily protein